MPFSKAVPPLYYEVNGPPPGATPVIVFAHGAGGNHLSWWQQVPHFKDRYSCVTFDHRGFGRSAEVEGCASGTSFVDDLRKLLDELGIERATLVAQSMGGWTCLGFALRFPHRVEKLVMCDTHGGLTSERIDAAWSEGLRSLSRLPPEVNPAAGERMWRERPSLHFLYAQISGLNPPRLPADLGALLRAAGSPTVDDVSQLDSPVLFITGEEDLLIPPRVCEMAVEHFRDARLERVPAAGHSVYFERAHVFNSILDRFLAAV